jgi:hypothetical protein
MINENKNFNFQSKSRGNCLKFIHTDKIEKQNTQIEISPKTNQQFFHTFFKATATVKDK